MNAELIRCRSDIELFDSLLKDPDVRRVNEQIAERLEEGPMGVRRRLLATSVRLSRRMGPEIHKTADECVELLGVDLPVELFVYSGPIFNAACFKPENDRLYVIFSSSLLEAFSGSELRFVMGHELGHYLYRHHDIPIGYILTGRNQPNPKLVLELFAWSRYAEISADRAGAHCARDFDGVARALFRLASGLQSDVIEFSLEDFLSQVDAMQAEEVEPSQGAPRDDWFSTHPFSPLRVKALQLFHESELARVEGTPVAELDLAVQELMSLMEPSYMEGRTDLAEVMRRLLFAGSIAVANADRTIGENEIEVFEKFFGKGAFSDTLDIERLETELDGRIEQTNQLAGELQRMQVLRDLCLIARAEGSCSDAERKVLDRISNGLQLRREFIDHALCCELELD